MPDVPFAVPMGYMPASPAGYPGYSQSSLDGNFPNISQMNLNSVPSKVFYNNW